MKNKRDKLFLFDIDGTLYDNDNKVVHESTFLALEELHRNNHVGIATGRAGYMLYSIENLLHLFDDFVLINGQYITSNGKVIYKERMDPIQLNKISKQMDSLGLTYGFQGENKETISKVSGFAYTSFKNIGMTVPEEDKNFYKKNDVFQAWVLCSPEEVKVLETDYPDFQFVKWLDVGYDILPKTANKGLGVKRLAKHLGILLEDVVVFGDGDNDVEMLRDAGLGIAMGNATKASKKAADYVTDSVDQNGIYNALKKFKFIK